ncbi:TPA: hypothetical protein ACH3X2_011309 [Trebouxia sp. C0005]
MAVLRNSSIDHSSMMDNRQVLQSMAVHRSSSTDCGWVMHDQQHAISPWTSRRKISSSQEPTCSCLAMDLPLLADLDRESPRNLCTSRKDLSLLAVKGLPDLCEVKDALLEEGPAPASLDDEEASGEWDREAARLRLAMMRAVESASAAGSDDDFSNLAFGEPAHATRGTQAWL